MRLPGDSFEVGAIIPGLKPSLPFTAEACMIAPLLLVVALQSAEVTEPNTQVKFPVQLAASSGAQVLTGTGVRTRTVLKVKVYAFGLYVDSAAADRKSTRLNSSHLGISYAVFCLKKKK